jgi:outer membrane protein assembly factor BamB
MIAVDCETGRVAWETPNPEKLNMSHSSIIPVTIGSQKLYVYCALGGIVGIGASGPDQGKILFFSTLWNPRVIAPSPVYLGNGRIFVTAGYGAGGMVLKVSRSGSAYKVDVVQKFKSSEGLASEQQTPVLYQGHLFSILPKDAGSLRNQFVCSPANDCTTFTWTSGKTSRFGLGPYMVADGKFYVLSDDGFLTILKASTKDYTQLARIKILSGVDCWGPLAIVEGRLLARDSRKLVCVDIRSRL